MNALQTRLAGRPAFFHPHLSFLSRLPHRIGLYGTDPMRRSLEKLIDFDLLNAGPTRLSVLAVDLRTGEEVAFYTTRTRLTVDHVMASAALIPDFPPVQIGERWPVDGGLAANVPIDVVLQDAGAGDLICYLVDLFPIDAPLPDDLAGMANAPVRPDVFVPDRALAARLDSPLRRHLRAKAAHRHRAHVVCGGCRRDRNEVVGFLGNGRVSPLDRGMSGHAGGTTGISLPSPRRTRPRCSADRAFASVSSSSQAVKPKVMQECSTDARLQFQEQSNGQQK
jgi:predicted acylesterase/phospholipase RssA